MSQVQQMQTKLQSSIELKLQKYQAIDKAMIQELKDEITNLERKHSELEELSQSDDHLRLLLVSQHTHIHCYIIEGKFKFTYKIRRRAHQC